MPLRLISPDGTKTYDLRDGVPLIVGRAPSCDLPVFHPTISRRHAELTSDGSVLSLRDLGSSNGTFVNGAKIEKGKAMIDDLLAFGKVGFRLESFGVPTTPTASHASVQRTTLGATIVRQIPMRDPTAIGPLNIPATGAGGLTRAIVSPLSAPPSDKSQQKLATLLEVSKGLTRAVDVDTILDKIVGYAYGTLEVDRVAILLCDEHDELVPKIARDKRGGDVPRSVPQSIARQAVVEKVALLTDNAGEDERFGGQSIVMQQVCSACSTWTTRASRIGSATTTSSSSSRSPASPRWPSRTPSSPSGSGARGSCGATSSATSRRSSPRASPVRWTARSWGATSGQWRCSSATSAASRPCRRR
jgi:adenylate cyclase